jgi:hypothetical protein
MSMFDRSHGPGDQGAGHSGTTGGTVGREPRTAQLAPAAAAPRASEASSAPAVPSIPMDADSLADRHAAQDRDLAAAMGVAPDPAAGAAPAPRPMRSLALMDDLDESSPRRRAT